jgi:hypothetical protein
MCQTLLMDTIIHYQHQMDEWVAILTLRYQQINIAKYNNFSSLRFRTVNSLSLQDPPTINPRRK